MTSDWAIRVPASSANLGAGFDVLGMALTLHAFVGIGDAPTGTQPVDETHPATIAYRAAGGSQPVWVRSPIPAGRGLGFSGAMRIGGVAAAVVEQAGPHAMDFDSERAGILKIASELEGHSDNAAPSLLGGVVIVAGNRVTPVPLGFDPVVVAWVPFDASTSTDASRRSIPETFSREDVVFNLGRVATFIAACAAGNIAALDHGVDDRLHQRYRLADQIDSARAIDAARAAGAWATWLSGSGPSVAAFCAAEQFADIETALPASGHVKQLHIDTTGTCVVSSDEVPSG